MKVTVWNENRHEFKNPKVRELYPEGIHGAIAKFLGEAGFETATATLDQAEHGLSEERLRTTDVLVWWGHLAHEEVEDEIVERVKRRVYEGMGLIVLHSAHYSKIFKALMGTGCDLNWREADEKERLWVIDPSHPIAAGIPAYVELEREEMYGEHFHIPPPDEVVMVSWFEGGEVFRSACTFRRGSGKIFYFRPGHETYPTYHNELIQRIVANGVRWAGPIHREPPQYANARQPLEPIGRGRSEQ